MKNFSKIILAVLLTFTSAISFAQSSIQRGIVRKVTHSKTDPTVPVKGVKVVVNNISSKASDGDGLFSLNISRNKNNSFALQDVRIPKDKNYVLAYPSISDKLYLSKNNLVIALITPEEKTQLANQNFKVLLKKYNSQEQELIEKRNALEDKIIELEESDRKYKEITHQLDSVSNLLKSFFDSKNKVNIKKELKRIASELAITDYQSLDSINAKIYNLKKEGNWSAIRDIIINIKMHGNAESFLKQRVENKKDADSLLLLSQKALDNATKELDDAMHDINTLIEAFTIQHLNDSVTKYYRLIAKVDSTNSELLNEAGKFERIYTSNYKLAKEYHEQALRHVNSEALKADILFELGIDCNNLYKTDQALELFNKSIDLKIKLYGSRSYKIAFIYDDISNVYLQKADYENALLYSKKSLNILIKEYGKEDIRNIVPYRRIAKLNKELCKYNEAEKYYLEALKLCKNLEGKTRILFSATCNDIALLYNIIGQNDKALEYYNKSLVLTKELYGEKHKNIGIIYNNIAHIYRNAKNFEKTLEYFNNALNLYNNLSQKPISEIANIYLNMSGTYLQMKDFDKSLEYGMKSLELNKQIFKANHPNLAYNYNNIGAVYCTKQNFEEAIKYVSKGAEIFINTLGEKHINVAQSYDIFCKIYFSMNNYDKALHYVLKSIKIKEDIFGKNTTKNNDGYHYLADIYQGLKEYKKAIETYKQCILLLTQSGDNEKDMALIYDKMGNAYSHLNDYSNALDYYKKAYNIYLKLYGRDNKDTMRCTEKIEEMKNHLN